MKRIFAFLYDAGYSLTYTEALWMQYELEMWDVMGPDDEASYPLPVDSLPPKGKECSASTRA